ncbi:hypothetical protein F511_14975 [Dorcoceras hygrometricum]|uniref:Uncharacterized protein n=1 Tax=Dorcoceras hygrometricum TaxID=472368 RepID=A0A2Z7BAD4_9LAMI|nr:hypothetical protein F511_14975 [Dorcoceras hygrometricum]
MTPYQLIETTPQHPTDENRSLSKRPTAEMLNNSNDDVSGFPLTKVKRRRLTTSSWSLKPTADHSTESNPSQRQRLISARTSAVDSSVDQHLTAARTRVNANCCFPLHTHC